MLSDFGALYKGQWNLNN